MNMDWSLIAAYGFGLLLLYALARVLLVPLRIIIKLIGNGVLGGILIALVDLVGSFFNFYLPINPISALVAGFLGLPGVALIIILHYLTIN